MFGLFRTQFHLWVDNEKLYSKGLFIFLIQRMKLSFTIEQTDCSIKYFWFSGIWHGHIYIDGNAVV